MRDQRGSKLVGANFNPSSMSSVDDIKQKCAELIDLLDGVRYESDQTSDSSMIFDEAVTQIMSAQMWAVKAVTFKI